MYETDLKNTQNQLGSNRAIQAYYRVKLEYWNTPPVKLTKSLELSYIYTFAICFIYLYIIETSQVPPTSLIIILLQLMFLF